MEDYSLCRQGESKPFPFSSVKKPPTLATQLLQKGISQKSIKFGKNVYKNMLVAHSF